MENDGQIYNIAEIRKLLAAAFDDPGLDAFCMDRFPSVYDRFSRGMRRDEKITLLLDHIRRRGDIASLLAAVRAREPELYVRFFGPTSRGTPPAPTMAPARGTRAASASPAPSPGPIRNRWALLVGVNRYVDPAFPPLNFCINDVLALSQTLKALGYTVVTLHDDAAEERLLPTRDNVEAELARLCQVAGPDDLLLVHFAGHGKLVDGRPVLVTRETRAPTLARRALPLVEVEKQMRESGARRLVLTLDACHTGVEIGRDLADPAFIRHVYELAEGFALIAASTAQQIAQEWHEEEHGVFTYYLLEGLSGQADRAGKGFVTVDDLRTHVLDGLRRWNVEHGGLLQEPTARTEGVGDIILADYRQ